MTLPRILIIDDQFVSDTPKAAVLRIELMEDLSLIELGSKCSKSNMNAEVVFCSGQTKKDGKINNDYKLIQETVASSVGSYTEWALVLLDVQFDSGEIRDRDLRAGLPGDEYFGEKVRPHLLTDFPGLPVVMLTSKHQNELQDKEYPYLSKTGMTSRNFSQCLLQYGRLTHEQKRTLLGLGSDAVAHSQLSIELFRNADKTADNDSPVLILGESGSGKEVLARYIHNRSARRLGPFVPVNVAAIPSELVESELFGHVRGSFTGAVANKIGKFQLANGGTLFLDEIGDMPLSVQVKVLRALQESEVLPIGGNETIPVNIRVLSATSRNISELTAQGLLRIDLLRRICPPTLTVSPLRERKEDIIPLVETFLTRYLSQYNKSGITLGTDAKAALFEYPFFGNIGELEYIIHHLVGTIGNNRVISGNEMSDALASSMGAAVKVTTLPVSNIHAHNVVPVHESKGSYTDLNNLLPVENLIAIFEKIKIPADRDKLDGLMKTIEDSYTIFIKRMIGAALKATRGNDKQYKYSAAMFLLLGLKRFQNESDNNALNENAKLTIKVKRILCQILDISDKDLAKNKQILATLVEQYDEFSRAKSDIEENRDQLQK